MIAVASAVILGFAIVFVIWGMIDGDIPVIAGLPSIWLIIALLAIAVRPPHPALSGVVLVVVLSLMMLFPFAVSILERTDHRLIDTDQLDRAYRTLIERPDNIPARFEIARALHAHGFRHEAVAIATVTLESLPQKVDAVQNRSVRDVFLREEMMVREWQRHLATAPEPAPRRPCLGCGHVSALHMLACENCGRAHLLERASKMEKRPKVLGKLVLAWASIALMVVGAAAIAVTMTGPLLILSFVGAFAGVGGFLAWLFKPPRPQ